jgi:hypothetical protein
MRRIRLMEPIEWRDVVSAREILCDLWTPNFSLCCVVRGLEGDFAWLAFRS